MTITKMLKRNNAVAIGYENVTAEGVAIVPNANDSRTVLLIKGGTAESVVTVVKGNSPHGATFDLDITVGANSDVVVSLDSALYKDMSTDGYLVKTSASGVKVACITLP